MRTINKILRKFIDIFLIITLMCSALTGCTNVVEIDDLGIILAIGIDINEDKNYSVSVQLLNVDSEISDSPINSIVYTATGETIFNALNHLNKMIGKKLNYSHMQYMVIGDNLARSGISSILDFSLRSTEVRPDIPMFVTKGNVVEILNTKVPANTISAFGLRNLINIEKKRGYTVITTTLDYVNSSSTGSKDAVIGEIEVGRQENNEINYDLSGAAVLKDDKLIGYLSPTETRALNWIRGEVNTGDVIIQYPKGNKISLDIKGSSSNISTKINNGRVDVKVKINVQSNIREMLGKLNPNTKPKLMEEFAAKEDEIIYSEIKMVLNKTQKELDADIFDFGNNVFRMHQKEWKAIDKNWDTQFKNMNIDVTVFSEIKQTGTISKSPK